MEPKTCNRQQPTVVVPTVDLKAIISKPNWSKLPAELAGNIEGHRLQLLEWKDAADAIIATESGTMPVDRRR